MGHFLRFRWLLAVLLGLGSLSAARASHIRGGDISYASIASTTAGVPRYHIVVREFEDAASIGPITTSVELYVAMGGCYVANAANTSRIVVAYNTSTNGLPLLCATSTSPYRVITFATDLDLPAGQWRISTFTGSRVSTVQNITNAGGTNLYVEAYLDNSSPIQDSSPKFESVLQPVVSTTALAQSSFSAFDADGDSLRYEQVLPYDNCNTPVVGTMAPHFHLNFGTGAFEPMVTSASTQGYYSTAIRVNEYRRIGTRWALLGSIMRDQLYLMYPTTNLPPTFTTMQVNAGAAQAFGPAIVVPRGQTVSVLLQATDPDAGQAIRFASEAPAVVPGLTLTRVGTTNSELLTWQVPATLPPGRYNIAVGVLDNGCPYNASEERTLTFVVTSATLATRLGANAAAEVYPTPFHDQVQFKTAPNQGVVLFDALGREVARLSSPADGLVRWQPAATLPAGLYFARSAADGLPLARLLRAE